MTEYTTTIGIDLGDKYSAVCVLDEAGEVVEEGRVRMTREALTKRFAASEPAQIAMESGTHSRWVSELLTELGHEVIVGNSRRLRMISDNEDKSDPLDARTLADMLYFKPSLLHAIRHRSRKAHRDLEYIKARETLVMQRKRIICHIRGVVKTFGGHLPSCDTDYFLKKTRAHVPEELKEVLAPLYEQLERLDEGIRTYDVHIKKLGEQTYPETELLREIPGVGPITALAYVLVIDDPYRFQKSREVAGYFGLRPRRHQSGNKDPQLAITKRGNGMMRRLLVQAAHYILGPFGPDCDLRRFGLRVAAGGGRGAKRRAVVAVARKLSVLLHRLWTHGELYEPLFNAQRCGEVA
jgi:transposase